jgi:hypothetical protein
MPAHSAGDLGRGVAARGWLPNLARAPELSGQPDRNIENTGKPRLVASRAHGCIGKKKLETRSDPVFSQESTGLSSRRFFGVKLPAIALTLLVLAGCNYSREPLDTDVEESRAGALPPLDAQPALPIAGAGRSASGDERRAATLASVMTLIERSAIQPGGGHFAHAIRLLNHYFEGTAPSEYQLESVARQYLKTQLPAAMLTELENPNWSLRDTRHIEDCMMYYGIANRVAGTTGENLERVRRVFDWAMRQVLLVPAGALRSARLPQAAARPYDVLLRGMATESDGVWAERAWLFIALCRQIDIDVGLATYTRSNTLEPRIPKYGLNPESGAGPYGTRQKPPVVWICVALIDDNAYLFDARVGLEVPGPGGKGVATLEDALGDPAILERMNLPGLLPYGTSRASLLASRTKIGVMIDSGQGYFAPKMRLLQHELAGKNRTILYRDPADERAHFLHVLGARAGEVTLWPLPMEVETRLFIDQQFVQSIQSSLFLFRQEFPLLYARIKQLRGELTEAIQDYGKLRLVDNAVFVTDKKTPIPKEVQDALDVCATYFLALAHLERNDLEKAEREFQNALKLTPEPGPNQPYYNMFRRGADANLGRIYASKQDVAHATAHLARKDPTSQYVGNQLKAREVVWSDPMSGVATLPPAPPPKPVVRRPPPAPAKPAGSR